MTDVYIHLYFTGIVLWIAQNSSSFVLPNATGLQRPASGADSDLELGSAFRNRLLHSSRDMGTLLEYKMRCIGQMERMIWDERLAKSAEAWAAQCVWDHGPPQLMRYMGQNLSIHSGRYRSIIELVKSWHDEKQYYSFPNKCSGSVCTHYTQMVWANTNRMGCAVNTCSNMNVWGSSWRRAVFLVCNYSIKGNWVGEAPYKMGRPCSACPPSYGGSCSNNLCSSGFKSNKVN
ncbi:peptidase inhibitor R3HDML [Huso huso]|uniref:Peptidase inhibitor R3HDML n=1 Tax=Huso huso TaxID=61971 RepID=A0ABR0Z3B4_HUSHU